jgi:hypothetical protein
MAEIGDVLYLKSGSQPMTVIGPNSAGDALRLMVTPGVVIEIPEAALTDTDPGPALSSKRDQQVAALAKAST